MAGTSRSEEQLSCEQQETYPVCRIFSIRGGCEMMVGGVRGRRCDHENNQVFGFSPVWVKLSLLFFVFFFQPAVWAELTAPNKTHHLVPGANLTGESLIKSDDFGLQTRTVKPHTQEDWHPHWSETLANAINATSLNSRNSHCWYWALQIHIICHTLTTWISCQHNMYVVPV